jgi:translation initiation factor 6
MDGKSEKKTGRTFSLNGSSCIGIFATCTESFLLLPPYTSPRLARKMERVLKIETIKTSIGETSLVGSLSVGNSNGFILSPYALDSEISQIEDLTQMKVRKLPDKMSAVGNIILANDTVALVHPQLSEKALEVVKETLGVKVYKGTTGGLKTVGMAAVATNKGILAHKNATFEELEFLEEIFDLPVGIGSVDSGAPIIGAALLANTKGYAAGSETTGAELGRIEDALGF